MPDPANSKTRATAAIAASVLTATGAGNASAASLVQNTGGPSSNAQQSRMQRTSKQAHPTLRIEQGSAINTTRSQTITVSGNGFLGEPVEKYGVAVYISEYHNYPLTVLSRSRAVTRTIVPASSVRDGHFATQLTLPAGTLKADQQYVVATAVVNPDRGYSVEDTTYNSWAPLEMRPSDAQHEPLTAQILSGQLQIPQARNLIVYKATGLGDAQAFEIMTYVHAVEEQGTRYLLAVSPARAEVVNGTLVDGIEVPGPKLSLIQQMHSDLSYVLRVEVAPSSSNGHTPQSVEVFFSNGWEESADARAAVSTDTRPGVKPSEVTARNPAPTASQDPALSETTPHHNYDLPRRTHLSRVIDPSSEQIINVPENQSGGSRIGPSLPAPHVRLENTAVPENGWAKTLTITGDGFEGVASVQIRVDAVDAQGHSTGKSALSVQDLQINGSGVLSTQVRVPGLFLKAGKAYRITVQGEDAYGTVRLATGGFRVDREVAPISSESSQSGASTRSGHAQGGNSHTFGVQSMSRNSASSTTSSQLVLSAVGSLSLVDGSMLTHRRDIVRKS